MKQLNKLIILRHGKAEPGFSCPDFERALTDKGRKHTALIAHWMQDHDCIPEVIISSPSTRTMQTANIIADTFEIERSLIVQHPEIYDASLQALLAVLTEYTQRFSSVLLVGHNPGLESLVEYLCPGLNVPLILQPSSLAYLTSEDSWNKLSSSSGHLMELIHSKNLS